MTIPGLGVMAVHIQLPLLSSSAATIGEAIGAGPELISEVPRMGQG